MDSTITKILFIDNDEMAFQVRQCMARVLGELPPVELFHANDATEGLQLLENLRPDVVILDDEVPEERDLFLDSVTGLYPPIVVQTEGTAKSKSSSNKVTYVMKNESLEGIHHTLLVATTLASKINAGSEQQMN
jgi:DNA-binding NarL/FixJ family response regulator